MDKMNIKCKDCLWWGMLTMDMGGCCKPDTLKGPTNVLKKTTYKYETCKYGRPKNNQKNNMVSTPTIK